MPRHIVLERIRENEVECSSSVEIRRKTILAAGEAGEACEVACCDLED